MSRMNGETHEAWQARRAFAIESAVATKAKELEYELKRRNGVDLPTVYVTLPCTCSLRPYPHFHSEAERSRFLRRMPPGNEESN